MIKPIEDYNGLNITFQVTEDCNLRCRYCYEVNKNPKYLSLDYAKRFIDIMLDDSNPIDARPDESIYQIMRAGLILDFIGGDALMVPELCDKIIEYFIFKSTIKKHIWSDTWRASISSNGTLFHKPEVRKFIYKYAKNLSIGVSVDGCPEIHNLNRDDSMNLIKDNWKYYLEFCAQADICPTTKATLNRDSIPYLYDSLIYLHEEMSLKYINMNFIFEDMGLTEKEYQLLDDQLDKCHQYILLHCDDIYWSFLGERALGDKMKDAEKGWCGAGSMPCLTVNGKIYPCFRFTPVTMEQKELDFAVGDVWNGFNRKDRFNLVRSATREKISEQKCLSCPIESICAWCVGGVYSCSGKLGRGTSLCRVNQIADKYARKYWNKYNEMKGIDLRYTEVDYCNCLISGGN